MRNTNQFLIFEIPMRVADRIPFVTRPCRRLPAKIPNPLPKTSSDPMPVEGGCLFYDLKAKAASPPTLSEKLPPLIKNSVGRVIPHDELKEMRRLRGENPKKWTITALSKSFTTHRSYIINNVLTLKERKQAEEELNERIDDLSINEKRGFLMRYKIREHRKDLW